MFSKHNSKDAKDTKVSEKTDSPPHYPAPLSRGDHCDQFHVYDRDRQHRCSAFVHCVDVFFM
jgi:hypothetical protein